MHRRTAHGDITRQSGLGPGRHAGESGGWRFRGAETQCTCSCGECDLEGENAADGGEAVGGDALKNRNTGEFIDNLHWWFWNGPNFPGLISRESFSIAADRALTAEDRTKLRRLLMTAEFQSNSSNASKEANRLLGLVSSFLSDSDDTQDLVLSYIEENASDAVKAYINVLEYWGFHYSWCDVVNSFSEPCLLIAHNGVHKLTFNCADIRFVQGRPFRFKMEGKGFSLSFDEEDKSLGLMWRNKAPDGPAFKSSPIELL